MKDNWIKTPTPTISRWPEIIPRNEFIEEVNDLINFLNRVKGLQTSNTSHKWMYQYIHIIKQNKKKIFQGKQIADALCEQLTKVTTTLKFYMTSYLVYVATSMRHFPGLSTTSDRSQVPIYKYFSQLTLSKSVHHFRRVNDAFFTHYMCLFDKEIQNKRVSDEAWKVVSKHGCIFFQFPTFTYIKIGCFDREPFMLPRYPSNKIILIEMACQISSIHEHQSRAHKTGLKFSIAIGRYSINSIYKARAMEEEMRRVTMRFFKP